MNIIHLPTADPAPVVEPNPQRQRAGDLGPNQLAWCRRAITGFRGFERDALKAQRHTERVKAKVRGHG